MVRTMNTASMWFKVARRQRQIVLKLGQDEWGRCAMENQWVSMTPTPPQNGEETAHVRLDRQPDERRVNGRSFTGRQPAKRRIGTGREPVSCSPTSRKAAVAK
jgi:hypothetical protein